MRENASEFSVGDVVALKSGGPQMTVIEVSKPLGGSGTIEMPASAAFYYEETRREPFVCQWFHEGKIHDARFTAASLVKVQP